MLSCGGALKCMLGSSTRQVNVYGRKGRTRIVQDAPIFDENDVPRTPPRAESTAFQRSTRSLFSGVDFRSTWNTWINSPRDAFNSKLATPLRQWTGTNVLSTPTRTPLKQESTRKADAQLSQALQDLTLDVTGLPSLLRCVEQKEPREFDQALQELSHGRSIRKIGEASFSEVYRCIPRMPSDAASIVKVIPLKVDADESCGIAFSSLESVEREVAMISALSRAKDTCAKHFVRLQQAFVVQGSYPTELLQAWDTFKEENANRSENVRPDVLSSTQLYVLIVMDDAGKDLECTPIASWMERAAAFWQVACAVAVAERATAFEHRDLHLGNILVQRVDKQENLDQIEVYHREQSEKNSMKQVRHMSHIDQILTMYEPRRTGIHATIIDYSLSRMELEKKIIAYDFSDESLFSGQGDTQYDVYRKMRSLVADQWTAHVPMTNVLWLQFVLQRLLASNAPPRNETEHESETKAYDLLVHAEQLAHEALENERRQQLPQRRMSTRSKRRSTQRARDALQSTPDKMVPTFAPPPRITSAWTWIEAVVAAAFEEVVEDVNA